MALFQKDMMLCFIPPKNKKIISHQKIVSMDFKKKQKYIKQNYGNSKGAFLIQAHLKK